MNILEGKDYDVIVCGCGSAGFPAAVAAARHGRRVAVVEKYAMPGGVMTVLGNNSIDQFNNPFRPDDKMVIQGIGWEFAVRLARMGYADIPDMDAPYRNHWQYGVRVNPLAAARLMDDMLLEAGVDLYYDQPLASAETEEADGKTRVSGILAATKAGLRRHRAKVYVDCTGDGDLCAFAGAAFERGDGNGALQPGTIRVYPFVPPGHTWPEAEKDGVLRARGDNCNHVTDFDAADSDRKTDGEIRGRRVAFDMMEKLKAAGVAEVLSCAPAVAPRESRRILCDGYMTREQYVSGEVFSDSVCHSFWFIDIHNDEGPATIQYLTDGQTPTIRLSSMIPRGLVNVLVAGRCVSADRQTNSALRVKASCMAMGEAAGTAAALAAGRGGSVRAASPGEVRALLARAGAVVPGLAPPVRFGAAMEKIRAD